VTSSPTKNEDEDEDEDEEENKYEEDHHHHHLNFDDGHWTKIEKDGNDESADNDDKEDDDGIVVKMDFLPKNHTCAVWGEKLTF